MQNKKTEMLLELANTIEKANTIVENLGYNTFDKKIAFIEGLFNHRVVHKKGDNIEDDYKSLLNSLINKKWRH
jgi:hypothetical protein